MRNIRLFVTAHPGENAQLARRAHRQRLQHHRIHQAEYSGVGANAERERQHGHQGERGAAAQHANAVTQVLDELFQPHPTARFVESLFGTCYVAEFAPSLVFRITRIRSLLSEFVRFDIEVGLNLSLKVAVLPFSPKHAATLPLPPVPIRVQWLPPASATGWLRT